MMPYLAVGSSRSGLPLPRFSPVVEQEIVIALISAMMLSDLVFILLVV
jgi:hypothetical protein